MILAMIGCGNDQLAAKFVPLAQTLPGMGANNEFTPAFPSAISDLKKRLGEKKFGSLQEIGRSLTINDMLTMSKHAAEQLSVDNESLLE